MKGHQGGSAFRNAGAQPFAIANAPTSAGTRTQYTLWAWLFAALFVFAFGTRASAQTAAPVIAITGPQGGPFPTSPATVTLANPHAADIHWAVVAGDDPWATFSRRRGTLAPGASGPLTATVDASLATQLPVGQYESRVQYRHPTTQQRVTLVVFKLNVVAPTYTVSLTPNTAFSAQGLVGGPFTPASQSYTLTNTGNAPFDWNASSSAPWAAVQAPTGGLLQPGASTSVVVQLQSTLTAALAAGTHNATLNVRRSSTNQVVHTRSITLTAQAPATGWTVFTPSADTRMVYVSTSGSDSNNGLSPNTPKRTIAAGKALIRNTYPDWLLLKRGDVFDEGVGQWLTRGRSATERQLISSYGTSAQRPLLRTGNQNGISAMASSNSTPNMNHIAIVGLEMWAHTYNGSGSPAGVTWVMDATGLLIEDCLIRGYQVNIAIPGLGGRKRDVVIRRNVLVDAFATSGSIGHAIYLENCDNPRIEENVIDRNGWNPAVPGAVPSIFRHGVYIQAGAGACTGVVVRGNIFSDNASHGLQMRPGGVCENNLFLRNSIALTVGGGHDPSVGGVNAIVKGNVMLEGKNIDSSNPRGWGMEVTNVASATISYNIIANQTIGTFPVPITLTPSQNGYGVHNTLLERNIISGWGGSLIVSGNGSQISGVVLRNNDFNMNASSSVIVDHQQSVTTNGFDSFNNRFRSIASSNAWMRLGATSTSLSAWSSAVGDSGSTVLPANPYPDPGRTISSYHQSLGAVASQDAFIAQARLQSRTYWRPEYTAAAAIAYVRQGFGLVVP
jgi:hypothetical protein